MVAVEFLRGVPIFARLGEVHLMSVAKATQERRFAKGETLFAENEPGDALYVVQSGAVKVYRVSEDGREKILAILRAGDVLGEMALLDGGPRSAFAQTLEPSVLLVLYRRDFLALLEANPRLAIEIVQVLCQRLRQANAQLMDLAFVGVRGRLARALLDLAERHGVDTPTGRRIQVQLTHQELANLIGTARETVSRLLTELQDERCIGVEGRRLVVRDAETLREIACL